MDDDNIGNEIKVIRKRPLPWRADMVSHFFGQLDQKHVRQSSGRSKDMTRPRGEPGLPSDRLKPLHLNKLTWLFK